MPTLNSDGNLCPIGQLVVVVFFTIKIPKNYCVHIDFFSKDLLGRSAASNRQKPFAKRRFEKNFLSNFHVSVVLVSEQRISFVFFLFALHVSLLCNAIFLHTIFFCSQSTNYMRSAWHKKKADINGKLMFHSTQMGKKPMKSAAFSFGRI